MALTDTQIRNAQLKDRPYKLSDGGGLHLLVKPSGTKLWRLKYRHEGKEKLLSFGAYPDVTLKAARKARDDARELIAQDLDPSEQRREARLAAQRNSDNTFAVLAKAYIEKRKVEGRTKTTIHKNEWLLEMANAEFGSLPASQVKAPHILKSLKKVEARGTFETARRLKTVIGSVLRYGIALGILDADPTPALQGAIAAPPPKSHAAITDKKEFGKLLCAVDGFEGQTATRIALQLMALLYPRPGELRQAEWSEFDLDEAVWMVPATRMKMRRPHRVPLPKAAIDLLKELHAITGHGQLAFPSIRSLARPMSNNTMNAALRRMGYTNEEMTSHGFRASFSTLANESGQWNPDVIERALAHIESNDVRRAYLRGEHWEERVRMANWWADELKLYRGMVCR